MPGLLHNFNKEKLRKNSFQKLLMGLGSFLGVFFLVLLLFFISVIYGAGISQKKGILKTADLAYTSLLSGYDLLAQAKLDTAASFFDEAGFRFEEAEHVLLGLSETLKPVNQSTLDSALHLAKAGKSISVAGRFLSHGLESLLSLAPEFTNTLTIDSSRGDEDTKSASPGTQINNILANSLNQLQWSQDLISQAAEEIKMVDSKVLPASVKENFDSTKEQISQIQNSFRAIVDFIKFLSEATEGYQKNILLLFQNTAEARPTGGFIGSY